LAVGDTVADAFAIGVESVAAAPNIPTAHREGDKFLLLPADGNHDVRCFVSFRFVSFRFMCCPRV